MVDLNKDTETAKERYLKQAIQEGLEDINSGRVFDGDKVFAELGVWSPMERKRTLRSSCLETALVKAGAFEQKLTVWSWFVKALPKVSVLITLAQSGLQQVRPYKIRELYLTV